MYSPRLFTVTSEHICFLLFSFFVLHFLVVGSVRYIKLAHVGFRAHVKIVLVSHIVSYRIMYVICVVNILATHVTAHNGVSYNVGVVYGFNISIPERVSALAKTKNVKVSLHRVIYKLIADVKERLSERLLPFDVEEQIGEFCSALNDCF